MTMRQAHRRRVARFDRVSSAGGSGVAEESPVLEELEVLQCGSQVRPVLRTQHGLDVGQLVPKAL